MPGCAALARRRAWTGTWAHCYLDVAMRSRRLVALACFALTGCGEYTCEDLCEDLNRCSEERSCSKIECQWTERFNDDSGCGDRYEVMLQCLDDRPEAVCDLAQGCADETDAYMSCANDFCDANPDECPAP